MQFLWECECDENNEVRNHQPDEIFDEEVILKYADGTYVIFQDSPHKCLYTLKVECNFSNFK